jgi:ATP-dependent protease ClpP protease subunit
MPKIAKLTINKDIGNYDVYAEMFGESQPCFSSNDVQAFIDENKDADEYHITIDSNGGNTTQGFAIYDMLVGAKADGKKIITIAYKANSIATVIFMAGDERHISKNAEFFIHNPALDPYSLGWDTRLTADELLAIAADVKETQDKMFNFYCEHLTLTDAQKTELEQMLKDETDLGSDKALELGFATAIINGQPVAKSAKLFSYSDKIAAIVTKNSKHTDMNKAEFLAALGGLKTTMQNAFKSLGLKEDGTPEKQTNAKMESLDSGSSIYFAEDSLADGIVVYSDEAMTTVASPGDYKLANGDTFTVDGEGKVGDYKEAELETDAQRLEAANAKIANLEAQINASKTAVIEAKKNASKVAKELVEINKTVQTLSQFVPGEGDGKPKGTSSGADDFAAKAKEAAANRRKVIPN